MKQVDICADLLHMNTIFRVLDMIVVDHITYFELHTALLLSKASKKTFEVVEIAFSNTHVYN